jgi:PAS domain-containing protein
MSEMTRGPRVRVVDHSVDVGTYDLSWPLEGLLMESMPDRVFVVNIEGRIVFANAQTENMTGYTREQLHGQSIELLVPQRLRSIHKRHREAQRVGRVGAVPTRRPGCRHPAQPRRSGALRGQARTTRPDSL